jgi:hypothetical protein
MILSAYIIFIIKIGIYLKVELNEAFIGTQLSMIYKIFMILSA